MGKKEFSWGGHGVEAARGLSLDDAASGSAFGKQDVLVQEMVNCQSNKSLRIYAILRDRKVYFSKSCLLRDRESSTVQEGWEFVLQNFRAGAAKEQIGELVSGFSTRSWRFTTTRARR